jgi:hypothetical protein
MSSAWGLNCHLMNAFKLFQLLCQYFVNYQPISIYIFNLQAESSIESNDTKFQQQIKSRTLLFQDSYIHFVTHAIPWKKKLIEQPNNDTTTILPIPWFLKHFTKSRMRASYKLYRCVCTQLLNCLVLNEQLNSTCSFSL